MTTILSDGAMVETATIGKEGMIGIEAFYGANAKASGETIMQVPDTDAEMMSVEAFREEMERHGAFHNLIARYAQVDRKSTRLNSSHTVISYAVFCLKKKKE